jgi:hypothetical protein
MFMWKDIHNGARTAVASKKKCEIARDVLEAQLVKRELTLHGLYTINVSIAS